MHQMLGLQTKITTLLVGMVGIGVIGTVAGTVPNRATGRESVSANCCRYSAVLTGANQVASSCSRDANTSH